MQNTSLIVAIAENYAIGKDNDLLWHLPADLKRFKELTTGNTIIMGRRTFESLPKGALPNRRNIVLSTNPEAVFDGAEKVSSLEEALELSKDEEKVFLIGGYAVFKAGLQFTKRLYLTRVHHTFPDAHVFFPTLDMNEWNILEQTDFEPDERHPYAYTFYTLERK